MFDDMEVKQQIYLLVNPFEYNLFILILEFKIKICIIIFIIVVVLLKGLHSLGLSSCFCDIF